MTRRDPPPRLTANPVSALASSALFALVAIGLGIAYFVQCGDWLYSDDWAMFGGLARGAYGVNDWFAPWMHEAAWSYYRPLATISVRLDYDLFGPSARAFHAVNIALLLCVAAGTARLAGRFAARVTLRRTAVAFAVAGIFVVGHPGVIEPMAWLTCRSALMSGLFTVLGGLAAVRFAASERRRVVRWIVAVGCFAAAALAKEDGIAAGAVGTCLAFGIGGVRAAVQIAIGALVVVAGYFALRFAIAVPLVSGGLSTVLVDPPLFMARWSTVLGFVFTPVGAIRGGPLVVVLVGATIALVVAGVIGAVVSRWRPVVGVLGAFAAATAPALVSDLGIPFGTRVVFLPIVLGGALAGIAIAACPGGRVAQRLTGGVAVGLAAAMLVATYDTLGLWSRAGERAHALAAVLLDEHARTPSNRSFAWVDVPMRLGDVPTLGGAVQSVLAPPFTPTVRLVGTGESQSLPVLLRCAPHPAGGRRVLAWSRQVPAGSHAAIVGRFADGTIIASDLMDPTAPVLRAWREGALDRWHAASRTDSLDLTSPPLGVSSLGVERVVVRLAAGHRATDPHAEIRGVAASVGIPGRIVENRLVFSLGVAWGRSPPPIVRIERLRLAVGGIARGDVRSITLAGRVPRLAAAVAMERVDASHPTGDAIRLVVRMPSNEHKGRAYRVDVLRATTRIARLPLAVSDLVDGRPGGTTRRGVFEVPMSRLRALGVRQGQRLVLVVLAFADDAGTALVARSDPVAVDVP